MELSKHLREVSRAIPGKEQMLISAVARALEVVPRQLSDNAGFDSTNILNKLRQKHAQGTWPNSFIVLSSVQIYWLFKMFTGQIWAGVDILNEDVADNMEKCVWEPSVVKINALNAAAEATCLILSVDETIKNPKYASLYV